MSVFLHIVPDDKFIDDAILFYDEIGGVHRWVCMQEEGADCFNYIKNSLVERVCFSFLKTIISDGSYDVVVIHFLLTELYSIIKDIPLNKTVIWCSWGGDIYGTFRYLKPLIQVNLYKKLTSKVFVNSITWKTKVKRTVKDILNPGRAIERYRKKQQIGCEVKQYSLLQQQAISRIDLCSTVIETEYLELKHLSFFKANFFPFKYVYKNDSTAQSVLFNDDCILVGNSRDPSNNHLDVLHHLNKAGISNTIILPLSYGEPKTLEVLREKYGTRNTIVFLTDYLSRQDYFKIIQHCKVAVFGHIRQQALGNINQCLLQGSKVFFFKDSIVYKFYKIQGVKVFSIEHDLNINNINSVLSDDEIERNRVIINELWSYDKVKQRVIESLISNGIDLS